MATEMAEVSNRVNFGSWVGRLTCPEKSGQREYPMISGLVRKKRYGIQCPENIGPASTWSLPAFRAKLKKLPVLIRIWQIQTLICKEMCKMLQVMTKSCWSRANGPTLVSNTITANFIETGLQKVVTKMKICLFVLYWKWRHSHANPIPGSLTGFFYSEVYDKCMWEWEYPIELKCDQLYAWCYDHSNRQIVFECWSKYVFAWWWTRHAAVLCIVDVGMIKFQYSHFLLGIFTTSQVTQGYKIKKLVLILKHRETHGCIVSTVATDALVLKHQAIHYSWISFIYIYIKNIAHKVNRIRKWNHILKRMTKSFKG